MLSATTTTTISTSPRWPGCRQAHDPLVVTPLGNDAIIRAAVPDMRIERAIGAKASEVRGATIHIEPAHHWSARGTRDR